MQRVIVGHRQHANRGIMQPTTAKLMMGGLRKIKDTVISRDSAHCGHCCRRCGRFCTNVIEDCPADGSTCRRCGKANDWKMCMAGAKDTRTRRLTRPVMSKKQCIHALENSKDTDNPSELYFDQLEINHWRLLITLMVHRR